VNVEAIQLTDQNAGEVGKLAKAARPGASYTNQSSAAPGALDIYNDGPSMTVLPRHWLVKVENQLFTVPDGRFSDLFEAV
jgi:hypothetical protein